MDQHGLIADALSGVWFRWFVSALATHVLKLAPWRLLPVTRRQMTLVNVSCCQVIHARVSCQLHQKTTQSRDRPGFGHRHTQAVTDQRCVNLGCEGRLGMCPFAYRADRQHGSRHSALDQRQHGFDRVDLRHHLQSIPACMGQQCQAGIGRLCASAIAVEQALTGLKLQRGDLLAERGWDIISAVAALLKLPASTTATKYSRRCRLMAFS